MPGNTFGKIFKITTFGESHGKSLGAIIDGCPAGLPLNKADIQPDLDRRKPGKPEDLEKGLTSPRQEPDKVEILSGVFEGKTIGTPIALIIKNEDARPEDYESLKDIHRPGHADAVYDRKYGHRDYRGGGRASGRETAARVAAGAVAKKLLVHVTNNAIKIQSEILAPTKEEIKLAASAGNSLPGEIQLTIINSPAGLGEPVFDKLSADLAKAMMSIPAARSFTLEPKDLPEITEDSSCGVQGGISSGDPIQISVYFKAPSSTKARGVQGRHDPCIVHRAAPVCEAMAAITLADHYLRNKQAQLDCAPL
jgi:chorismate synthase